ncbi:AraC family transcriptional regulator [Aquabacterium sp. J223]|uniref:AraC family transcriptional regulator n=1 Tax=Aquabacterium sp. J223 TaxID=2898431 RepID=UPI0021ADCF43|nr:AraC family transcriptional regulator [Aquabacterium sp. J223]UUX95000.1 AraC family transcriptional regulator [Aquabacterium sp. J223]
MTQRTAASSADADLARLSDELARRVARLATDGQMATTALPGLTLYRSDSLLGSVCGVYEPCVALILQGSKQVLMGDHSVVYGRGRFLIASLDLPVVATILEASAERPYLALALRLDLREIAALLLDEPVPPPRVASSAQGPAMATGVVTPPLLDAFRRLLDLLDQPQDLAVLAPLVRREILYRLLVGEAGARLRQIAAVEGQAAQVARAIALLKTRYTEPLRIEDLARQARMSPSTFHHHFKALTAMSPLQYQKRLRLTEARRLMLADGLDAATAAYRVGYESPSQFSREYSRQFGAPPVRDISGLRTVPEATLG